MTFAAFEVRDDGENGGGFNLLKQLVRVGDIYGRGFPSAEAFRGLNF